MQLLSVRLENIGGFRVSGIATSENKLLIGENNSGKTSLLRVVDWCLNGVDRELLEDRRDLTSVEQTLLIPARETRNRARRIFLRVAINDGRTARKFQAKNGIAEVRIQFRSDGQFAKLSSPARSEKAESEEKAIELIQRLQDSYCALYIGAARDGHSELFETSLRAALRAQFQKDLIHDGTGRLKPEPKKVRQMADVLGATGNKHAMRVWRAAAEHLEGVFDVDTAFDLELTPADVVDLLVDRLRPVFSLGDHDINRVAVDHLGAGLQSVLAIALMRIAMSAAPNRLLLLEEPEAFLHPSAQRTMARQVFRASDTRVIATTHSSTVLAEATPREVVVMRDHSAFPAVKVDQVQEDKDRYFLSTWASGSMFDRSLLLVEGPGDLAFLEELRRKMEDFLPIPTLSRMRVAATGSKDSFGPWLRLLRRYHDSNTGVYAFDFLVCADSADASASVARAFRESGISLPLELSHALNNVTNGINAKDISVVDAETIRSRTQAINDLARKHEIPFHFTPVDLEYAMLAGLSDARATEFGTSVGLDVSSRDVLAAQLGSKGGVGPASDRIGAKAPYVRAALARFLKWSEVSPEMKDLLWRWSQPAHVGAILARPDELWHPTD